MMENLPYRIVITGPESTGKTELATYLAKRYRGGCIPEYARSYVEKLGRRYTYSDVEHIARVQESQLGEAMHKESRCIFLDTYLVITKVWFMEVFERSPGWIDDKLRQAEISLFLLCYHDLEWIEDGLRENPGTRREYLFRRYAEEIALLGRPLEVIRGFGRERFENAGKAILRHIPELKSPGP